MGKRSEGKRNITQHRPARLDANGCLPRWKPKKRYIPVTKWNDYHDWPTADRLQSFILQSKHGEKKGFDKVFQKLGQRVLIDEKAFFDWVDRSIE